MLPFDLDYKKVVNIDVVTQIKCKGYHSLAEFCSEIGIDRSTLSKILYGYRNIGFASKYKISQVIELQKKN